MGAASDTDNLLSRVQIGDPSAASELLDRFRDKLRNLVLVRLDRRVASRVDASDVVQDTMVKAAKRMEEYAQTRPVAFYPWLRKIALDRITELHREHIRAQRRSVTREVIVDLELSDVGRNALAKQLASREGSPSRNARIREDTDRAQRAINELRSSDREVLVLRYVEQLTPRDAAAVLEITENAFAQRHLRAIRRVREILNVGRGE